jgi:hypothetical protein
MLIQEWRCGLHRKCSVRLDSLRENYSPQD